MANDVNKTPPSGYDEDTRQKKRIPVYILILVGDTAGGMDVGIATDSEGSSRGAGQ